jgi:trehalose 6-phosphate synthase
MSSPDILTDQDWLRTARSGRLALLLDLDGTLVPFAPRPEDATLDTGMRELLKELTATGVHIVIVTGRQQRLVDAMCSDIPGAWFFAEHGAWQRCGAEWKAPQSDVPELDELAATLTEFRNFAGTRIEQKSLSLAVHWREVTRELREAAIAAAELACEEWLETRPQCERIDGVEMLEVRLRAVHKGTAVARVREQLPDVPIIAIGDDETDEDMFAALGSSDVAIAVRNLRRRASRASHWLASPRDVRVFLEWVLEARTSAQPPPPPAFETHTRASTRARARLVVVSNRIPPQVEGRQRPVGGLVAALEPALRTFDGIWLGWSGMEAESASTLTIDDDSNPVRASFDIPPAWRQHYYSGFCNRALWPLLHGFPGRVRYRDQDWRAYAKVNEQFARHALDLVTKDGALWVHDYHLLLVARSVRERRYWGPVGMFLHVPFPGPDVFDTLPWCDELLAAMCEYDLIGFHTEQWAENFRACMRGHERRRGKRYRMPELGVLPIGIDPMSFSATVDAIDRDIAGLRAALGARRMILGVDRLDYSKGIPERLLAFEALLERYPEWRSQVSLVQISVPSREEVPEYAELRTTVEKLVGRINGRYGEADWVPVRYLYRSYDHRVLAQLYRLADIALVTPLRDGLNLVAKEFIAAQDNEQPGVLVLSRFAGAAEQLTQAVLTNPYHADGLAADLDFALRMPQPERRRRHELLRAVIAQTSPERWASMFVGRLREAWRPSA